MALESNRVGVRSDQVDTFGRVTSPSFLNELLDCLPEWTDMPVYKGGTEEILPSNTAVPTTSPIVADIKYPDGMRENQVFTYRETPAEVDGLAKIKSIKGNTLVWNQLVEKGNMTDGWAFSNSTGSYANNILTFTATAQGGFVRPNLPQSIISGHKYLGTVDVKGTSEFTSNILFVGRTEGELNSVSVSTVWQTFAKVFTNSVTENNYYPRVSDRRESGWDAVQVRNCMLIDLTAMFGAGKEPATVAEFTSLFPLPYYTYNIGTLLNFNGTGIKTTDSTLSNDSSKWGNYGVSASGYESNEARLAPYGQTLSCEIGKTYTVNLSDKQSRTWLVGVAIYDATTRIVDSGWQSLPYSYTVPSGAVTVRIAFRKSDYSSLVSVVSEVGKDLIFELYTETNTTSLPKTDYYPTGLKSAGSVYDELTPRKAEIRVGTVDLGTLTWADTTSMTAPGDKTFTQTVDFPLAKRPSSNTQKANIKCATVDTITASQAWFGTDGDGISINADNGRLQMRKASFLNKSAEEIKSLLSGVYLNYELATPVELPTIEFE